MLHYIAYRLQYMYTKLYFYVDSVLVYSLSHDDSVKSNSLLEDIFLS